MSNPVVDRPHPGWIGTGRIGLQLAARPWNAGHDMAVSNRTRDKAEPLPRAVSRS